MTYSKKKKKRLEKIKKLVSGLFKNSSQEPFYPTDGQADMFMSIITPHIKWLWQSAPTRYGKSDILGMALLYLAVVKHLKIPVVAGTQEKANKIMEYVVTHVSDHPELSKTLMNEDISKVDRLKIQMSKQGLRWSDGGWIYITSIESRKIIGEGERVVGEGGDVVVLEEAGLIKREEQFSKVVRMPEENRGWGKLIMSGNAIENSIFEKAYRSDLYVKKRIGLDQAVDEGRFTWKYLKEKKSQTTTRDWKRYYLVEFPDPTEYAYFKPKKYQILPNDLIYVGAVDLSLGEGKTEAGIRKRSKTGVTVLGVDEEGQIYEVESFEEAIGPDEVGRRILNMPYEFHRFGVEAIQFQKYFLKVIDQKSKELKKYIPFIGIKQKRKKEERIEGLEPHINTGQILFRGDNDLWSSMQNYPDLTWFDGLDSFEMAWRLAKQVGIEIGTIARPGAKPFVKPSAAHVVDISRFTK